jgi:hypothetical protein
MSAKTWGPFSGRQLATMFVATMAVIASGTVWAVGPSAVNPFSYIAIQDPVTGNKAAVDISRRLIVSDQLQAVAANPANHFWAHGSAILALGCVTIAAPPAGKALIIQTLVVDAFAVPAAGSGRVFQFYNGAGNCSVPNEAVNPAEIGVTAINYLPGMAVPAGGSFQVKASADLGGEFTVTGYVVPASWVPVPTLNLSATPRQAGINGR